jgi:hypothetical protein
LHQTRDVYSQTATQQDQTEMGSRRNPAANLNYNDGRQFARKVERGFNLVSTLSTP